MNKNYTIFIVVLTLIVSFDLQNATAQTWSPQNSGVTHYFSAVHFADANIGAAVGIGAGNVSAIVTTNDGGTTWIPRSLGSTKRLNDVFLPTLQTYG